MDSLATRRLQAERMDDPDLDPQAHEQALRGLARINFLSASARLLWKHLRALLEERGSLMVLDLACGAGDVTVALARRGNESLTIEGCDLSARALERATALAKRRRQRVRFFEWDVLTGPLPHGYDVYICSLFLHHLTDEQATDFLARTGQGADAIVIQDLMRCRPGMLLARAIPPLVTRSAVVKEDAVISIGNAFTPAEAVALAERAGLSGARATRHWPFRFLLEWKRA